MQASPIMMVYFHEWMAARRGEQDDKFRRFTIYRRARLLLEGYLGSDRFCWFTIGEADFAEARAAEQLTEAEQLFREALNNSRTQIKPWDIATALYELGLICHVRGQIDEAHTYFSAALYEIRDSLQIDGSQVALLSDAYYHIGILYWRQGQPAKARAYLDRSSEIDLENLKHASLRVTEQTIQALGLSEIAPAGIEFLVPEPVPELNLSLGNSDAPPDVNAASMLSPTLDRHFHEESNNLRPATIWILSYSEEAGACFQESIATEIAKSPVDHAICRTSIQGEFHPANRLTEKDPLHPLCAIVLVLENDGFRDQRYLDWLAWATSRVAEQPDFRLFVGVASAEKLCDFQPAADVGDDGRKQWVELTDTVQLNALGTPSAIASSLVRFLSQVPYLRSRASWRNLTVAFAEKAVVTTSFLEVVAFAVVSGAFLALTVFETDISDSRVTTAIALCFGVTVAAFLVVLAFFVLRGVPALEKAICEPPIVSLGLGSIVYFSLGSWLWDRLLLSGDWFLLGMASGILLEEIRRASYQLLRRRTRLAKVYESIYGPSPNINEVVEFGGVTTSALWCPLYSKTFPRILISYARRLPWSEDTARSLYRSLVSQRGVAYFDANTISDGSHWLSVLNECLTDCDIFVGLIEPNTYGRKWVATELLTALNSRVQFGLPEIILIRNLSAGECPLDTVDSPIPVMASLARQTDTEINESRFRILSIEQTRIDSLAAYLGPYRYSTDSVIPTSISRIATRRLLLPIVCLGPIGEICGWPAALLWLLETERVTNWGAALSEWGMLGSMVILLMYWAGFTARLTAYTAYEMRLSVRHAMAVAHAVAAIGLFGLACAWLDSIAHVTVAWSILACVLGWNLGSHFIYSIRNETTELR